MLTPTKTLFLKSSDGELHEVDRAVASQSILIKNAIEDTVDKDSLIHLPNVKGDVLLKVIEYCNKHFETPSNADADLKAKLSEFDAEFVKLDRKSLCDLLKAANYLNLPALLDVTMDALADNLKDISVEEFRKTFNIVSDLSEVEELKLIEEEQALEK